MVKYEDTTPEERQQALDDVWKIRNQKVYRIGDDSADWVVANSEKEAVDFYSATCGIKVEELYEQGVVECAETDTIEFSKDDVPKADLHLFEVSAARGNNVHVPFTSSLFYFADKEAPYIIGSTEG